MGILRRLKRLDERVGLLPPEGADRIGRLQWLSTSRLTGAVPHDVYRELVELHDRVARLEAAVQRLDTAEHGPRPVNGR